MACGPTHLIDSFSSVLGEQRCHYNGALVATIGAVSHSIVTLFLPRHCFIFAHAPLHCCWKLLVLRLIDCTPKSLEEWWCGEGCQGGDPRRFSHAAGNKNNTTAFVSNQKWPVNTTCRQSGKICNQALSQFSASPRSLDHRIRINSATVASLAISTQIAGGPHNSPIVKWLTRLQDSRC